MEGAGVAAGGAAFTQLLASWSTPSSTRRLRVARSPFIAASRRASSACGRSRPRSARRRNPAGGQGWAKVGAGAEVAGTSLSDSLILDKGTRSRG